MKNQITHTKKLKGTFLAHPRGYGFVTCGDGEDLYIPANMTRNAFHMDEVEAEVVREKTKNHRAEGRIINVISHGISEIVGTYDKASGFGFVIPDDPKIAEDIYITKENSMGAATGHKVVALIRDYGDRRHRPEGVITEILGDENDPGVNILSILKGYGLPDGFPEAVKKSASRIPQKVSEKEVRGRRDLRDLLTVTIDGEDTKDYDDAVTLTRTDKAWLLGVHIADVSNYVKEGGPLDEEAQKRGTSVYFPDRVIPMLPEELSNGICSLNMGEDRLALSCLMNIDQNGQVTGYEITESVIRVDERMTYTDVNELLEMPEEKEEEPGREAYRTDGGFLDRFIRRFRNGKGKEGRKGTSGRETDLGRRYAKELPMFRLMAELAEILHEARKERGSIDFDIPESRILVDEDGHVRKVEPYDRGISQRIIEEFMLLANETVAGHFYWLEAPFVYRTHGVPDAEKILKLGAFINNFGYSIKVRSAKGEIHPKEVQKLLRRIEGTDEEALISRLTLRSMQRAEYNTACTGHFGLAAQYYCHFTSPIRRYPDLQIHRIIKESLRGELDEGRTAHYEAILPGVARQSSELERRAVDAEREVDKLLKAGYMAEHIGEEYDGVISGITDWGIYVELPSTIEGMIHVSKIPGDYYYYNESTYELIGRDTGKTYRLGQKIRIRVDEADTGTRTIDFSLAEE
ncbi:MAG: RNB domain-containing ribonuclease [Lachnospiraceae bacterium]|nr:RNB domain-containing ribonuclease [Lachnospiraceae bacterium]